MRQPAVLARDPVEPTVEGIPDERLRLIFTC
jgi:RNA polymerase sigma-70 factor (ECF subfamily)